MMRSLNAPAVSKKLLRPILQRAVMHHMILIFNRYQPTAEGAYGGFLPTVSEWTKMNFSGPGTYIWFKTTGDGYVSASGCFSSGDPQWINNILTWAHRYRGNQVFLRLRNRHRL